MNYGFDKDMTDGAESVGLGVALDESADFEAAASEIDLDDEAMFEGADESNGDLADSSDGIAGPTLADLGEPADEASMWTAFEEEIADGLDASGEDEFLGRLLGGLGRAAGLIRRGQGGRAGESETPGSTSRQSGRLRSPATSPRSIGEAGARLARMLGAQDLAPGLDDVSNGVGRPLDGGSATGRGDYARDRDPAGTQALLGRLAQLVGAGGDELDDFESMADLYDDGMDEALPAAVALAARAAARGLGLQNVAKLSAAGRRALVRGVASAARELVRAQGPAAIRVLPRLAQSAARVAQSQAPTPRRAAQVMRRGLPKAARHLAQSSGALQRVVRAGSSRPDPIGRDARLGRGHVPSRIAGRRTFYIDGPVSLTVTPR